MKYIIDKSLVDDLMQYLLTKPMREVEGGVNSLRQLQRLEEKKDEVKDAGGENR